MILAYAVTIIIQNNWEFLKFKPRPINHYGFAICVGYAINLNLQTKHNISMLNSST